MKLGFSKKDEELMEDITREEDKNSKDLLVGLGVATALLTGIAAVSWKVAEKFKGGKDDEDFE